MKITRLFNFFLSTLFFILLLSVKGVAQCSITDLVVTKSQCDENDRFSVEINFNFNDTGANGFQLLGNGNNYGTFQYAELPITIEGLIGNCTLEYEFIVRDVIDPTCAAFLVYGTVCCDDVCTLSIIDFETTDCISNISFGINLSLDYAFVGNNGYSVTINDTEYGTFSYENLPLSLDNITSDVDGINVLTICDNDAPECCVSYSFLNPCVCQMTNITSNIIDCNSTDTSYYVIIDFDHIATNDSFQMGYSNNGTNIFLGTFAYSDLPITAGPIFLSQNEQEILIVDKNDFFCFSSAYLGIVEDCTIECQIFNVFAEAYLCEEGVYFMDVEFEAKDIEGYSFDILVDGIHYGTFEYGENVYTIGPIPSNCDFAPTVVVQDSGVESCSDFFNLAEPVCCLPDCNFTSFEATTICGPTTIQVNGIFENNGIMLSSFYFVELLGTSYGPFLYSNFMFSIEIPLLANGEYEITINDSMNPECQISTFFAAQCEDEPCIIFNVFAEPSECEENLFFVDVEFEFGGDVSDSFAIVGNGMNYGTFAYGEQFYAVGPLEGDCETIYEFVISDQSMGGCSSSYTFSEPVCCSTECSIRDIQITEFTCSDEENISDFTIDFIHKNTPSDKFEISIDGLSLGSFFYTQLPLQFEIPTAPNFEISIQDTENNDCQAIQDFALDCTNDDCAITSVDVAIIECSDENNNYFIELNIIHANTSQSVEIYINEIIYITVDYTDFPITVGPLSFDEQHLFFLADSELGNCTYEFATFIKQCPNSLDEASFNKIKIYQSGNALTIENNEVEDLKFQLFSTTGALVDKMDLIANFTNSFDTSEFPRGLYFLNISNNSSQKTVKLVVY